MLASEIWGNEGGIFLQFPCNKKVYCFEICSEEGTSHDEGVYFSREIADKKIHSGAFHKKNCLFFVHVGMWLKKAAERHAVSVRAEIYCRMCVCKQFPKQLKGSYEKTSKYLRFLCHINARHSMFFSFSYTKKIFFVESLKSENMTN